MPNYVLDSSATQVNTAINNVVNAQTAPSSGSGLMVTSDGIYQALNNIQHGNFNTGTLVTSTDTIASNISDTQIPTTQAVDTHITNKLSQVNGFNISNLSNTYQDVSAAAATFMQSSHFSSGLTGDFFGFTETSSGLWQAGTTGYYLIIFTGTFNDTSSSNHNIQLYVNGNVKATTAYDLTDGDNQEKEVIFTGYLTTADYIAAKHDRTSGSGGVFQYKNATFKAIKIA